MKTINNSDTFTLYTELVKLGFNAEVKLCYSNEYNQDYDYLCVNIYGLPDTGILMDKCQNFEVILSRKAEDNTVFYEIRKHRRFAELIEKSGIDYSNFNKRETSDLSKATIFGSKEWSEFYCTYNTHD